MEGDLERLVIQTQSTIVAQAVYEVIFTEFEVWPYYEEIISDKCFITGQYLFYKVSDQLLEEIKIRVQEVMDETVRKSKQDN